MPAYREMLQKKKVYKSSYDLEMDSMEIPQILLWI